MLLATEWLDNVPLDVAEVDGDGRVRRVLVDPATGAETPGARDRRRRPVLAGAVVARRPGRATGSRSGGPGTSPGRMPSPRCGAGVRSPSTTGICAAARPRLGTLTGFRGGRQVAAVPDGRSDVTAHVALDSAAVAAGTPYKIVSQREALRGLGVDGGRPPLDLARTDPAAYLRALSAAGAAAELTDPDGLGGHWWLLHEVGIELVGRSCRE